METTWRLRPNLTWHDDNPLVADDFVLAIRFIKSAGLTGIVNGITQIEGASARDARTLVVQYNSPFPDAGKIAWQPLPRHILGSSLEQIEDATTLATSPYWTTEFVGAGPYRLERWEPGAFVTGTAFTGYANGKPAIGRIQLVWNSDGNAVVASLLTGAVQFATDLSIAFEHVSLLKREWAARNEPGIVLLGTAKTVYVQVQYKSEYQQPTVLRNARFRQALASGIDKQAIVDAVLDGEPGMADTLIPKHAQYYHDLDRVLAKYPHDLRRVDQLIAEMGFTKDSDGFYGQAGARVSPGLTPFGDYQREALVLADGWKRAGIDTPLRVLSTAEQLSPQYSQTYPALGIIQAASTAVIANVFIYFASPAATGRTGGPNMGGYIDPEIDRLYGAYTSSLEQSDRNRAVVEGMKLLSDQAAYLPLYYAYEVVAHAGSIMGPRSGLKRNALWNLEEWRWQ
jgi:peptide/nickel transport system substrate-binding protein